MAYPPFARDSAPIRKKRPVRVPPIPAVGGPGGFVPNLETPAGAPGAPADPNEFYRRMIENDPYYQQQTANLSAQGIAGAAERAAALKRAYVMFGEQFDPAALGFTGGNEWLDDTTRGLAAENTRAGLSTVSRLGRAHDQQVGSITDVLAARGMSRSGATGSLLGQEQQAYTQAQYDSRQKLADYAAGVNAALAQSTQQREQARLAALQEASARQAGMPWNTPPAGTTVPRDPTVPPPFPGIPASGGLAGAQGLAYGSRPPVTRRRRIPLDSIAGGRGGI